MATRSRSTIIGSGSPLISYAEGASTGGGGAETFYSFVADGTESEINIKNEEGVYFIAETTRIVCEGTKSLRRKTARTTSLGNWEFEEIANGDGQYYAIRLKAGIVFNSGENVDVFYKPSSS